MAPAACLPSAARTWPARSMRRSGHWKKKLELAAARGLRGLKRIAFSYWSRLGLGQAIVACRSGASFLSPGRWERGWAKLGRPTHERQTRILRLTTPELHPQRANAALWGPRRSFHIAPSSVRVWDAVRILLELRTHSRSLWSSASSSVIQYGDPALSLRALRSERWIQ